MKTTFLNIVFVSVVCIAALLMPSCDKKSDTNYSIDGKIDNLSVKSILAVAEMTADSLVIDTIAVNNKGEFSFKGKIDEPTLISLYIGEKTVPVYMLAESGYSIKIKGDALQSDMIEVKGGTVNDDINDFRVKNANLLQSRHRILSKNENLDPAELKNINLQLARNVREYVEGNPTKIAGVILMNEYSINNTSAELLGKDIEMLQGAAANFYLTTNLKDYYDKIKGSAIGAVAPGFELKDVKGKTVKLTDFRKKPVLLVFDLKNSPTNTEYFDNLKEVQKKIKKEVQFISIVIDEDDKLPDPQTLAIAKALDWTVLFDGKKWNSKEVKKYNVTSAPYMILISSEGLIEERDVSLDSLLLRFEKK